VNVEQRGKNYYITEDARQNLNERYARMIGAKPSPQKQGAAPSAQAPRKAGASRPAALPSAAPAAAQPFTFDYTVRDRRVSEDGKLTAVSLCDRQGQSIVCLRRGNDNQLAQGICLRNVRLNQQRGRNNEVVNVLESYEIAA